MAVSSPEGGGGTRRRRVTEGEPKRVGGAPTGCRLSAVWTCNASADPDIDTIMEGTMSAVRSGTGALVPEEAFRRLFHRHYGAVFAYVARRVGRDDAGDVAAEVFTVAWRRIRRIPTDAELPWLYGVARRVVANHLRSVRRRGRLAAKAGGFAPRRVEDDPADLEAVLASLPEADREVLMLAAWEGLDPASMGRALGCSASAASVRLHRARARLSEAWDRHDGGER
jgi:RNA polymerase sigma-70 factor, ECF subfamily